MDSKAYNHYLYKTYGHTVTGLKKNGYNVDISEFNEHVYSTFPYSTLFSDISKTHTHDIESFRYLLKHATIPVHIFSNAPHIWCQTILHYMNMPLLPIIDTENLLKPQPEVYSLVASYFPQTTITLVDDNQINFQPIMNDRTWSKVHMTDNINLQDVLHLM